MFIGELAALGAAFLWSTSSFVFTTASLRIGTIQLNVSRMVLAAILLMITIALFGINYSMTTPQVVYLSISGFIGLVIGDTALFKAFKEIGPRVSMLLMSFNPAIAALTAYFLIGETLSLWVVVGIGITLAGIFIVILERPGGVEKKFHITKAGVFFGFIAAAGQGIGLVFAKMAYQEGDIHSLVATLVRIAAAVLTMLPMAMLLGRYTNPFRVFRDDKKSLGLVAIGSIIGPYLGITFSFLAIIYTKVGIASTLMATVPIIMLPLSRYIYKERLNWQAIAGAMFAVMGVAILFLV
ncbi:MAG: DMT family transporter [Candidatus Kapaibacterium sp.]